MAKAFLTEYRLELGSMLAILFGVLTLIGIIGTFFMDELPAAISVLEDLARPFGGWSSWLVVIGPIGLIICIIWLYDYYKKARKLSQLMDTPSRAKFVRNLDDIEYLAWSLPQRYEDKVIAKKKELGL